jgi:biopolymer transport protein ExbB/TolQ
VGTIANVAVYIGLFGTVLGIVNAFHSIATAGTTGLNIVIGGVSEALLNTAMGLGVAIPAVVFFNWIMKQIKTLTHEMDCTASELLAILESEQ